MLGSTLVLTLAAAVPNPHVPEQRPVVLDFSPGADNPVPLLPRADDGARFSELDAYQGTTVVSGTPGTLPEGWTQHGGVVIPPPPELPLSSRPEIAAGKVMGPDKNDLCAYPDAVPAGVYTGEFRTGSEYPRRGTIYMNYTGGTLYNGMGDNSAENWSALAYTGKEYPVYLGGEERAIAVAQAVQNDFAQYALRVVYLERPPKVLPYVMIMMGGDYTYTTAGPSGGVAPGSDCEDLGMRNVCFAFVGNESINSQANVASQEIGHTMGLGHTEGSDRFMAFGYDTLAPTDMKLGDECTPVITVQGQSGACLGVNKCHCNDGNLQHDVATLAAIYAPTGPDVVPPEISITAPADGAVFQEKDDVVVTLDAWDDFGGYGWKLVVEHDGEVVADVVDYTALLEFKLAKLPAGTYKLTAIIQDHADQTDEHSITITVEGAEPPTTGGTDSETGDDTGDTAPTGTSSTSGETGSSSETGDSASGGQSGVDEGCACRNTSAPTSPLWLLAALAVRPRRRRSR